jgi:hypothetical protein
MIAFGRFAPALPAFCFFVLICKPLAARYGIGPLGFGQNDRRSAGLRFQQGRECLFPQWIIEYDASTQGFSLFNAGSSALTEQINSGAFNYARHALHLLPIYFLWPWLQIRT